jgi:hypothetical protein
MADNRIKSTYTVFHGEVAEWLKAHDWKSCIRLNRIGGSNPPLSAKFIPMHSKFLMVCLAQIVQALNKQAFEAHYSLFVN